MQVSRAASNRKSTRSYSDRAIAARLVGREQDLATLEARMDEALNGAGSVVLISGEAGIGKTSLMQAITPFLRERDSLVLEGGCYDLSMTPPYGLWIDAMRGREAIDDLPSVPAFMTLRNSLDDLQGQEDLFASVLSYLTEVAERAPLALLLEDLHWSDHASLDLLRFVARNIRNHRILLLATYRDDELPRHHPLYILLPTLIRESRAERIELRRLSDEDIRLYVSHRYSMTEPNLNALTQYLTERSDGNPLLVHEILRTLEFERILRANDEQWSLDDLDRAYVPNLIQQMVEGRLAKIDSPTVAAIQAAAIIGQHVPLEMWESIIDESRFEDRLDQALATGLLRYLPGADEVHFSHALVRQAIYDRVGLSERRELHLRVAEEYLCHPMLDPTIVSHHLKEASDPRVVEWLVRAGEQAERRYAHYEAFMRYREALDVLHQRSATTPELATMLVKVGCAANLLDPEQSNDYLFAAREIALSSGDDAIAALSSYFLGVNLFILGETERGLTYLQQSIDTLADNAQLVERLTSATPPILPSRVGGHPVEGFNGVLAESLAVCGRYDEAVSTAERYLDPIWRELTDQTKTLELALNTDFQVHAYEGLGIALSALGDTEAGRLAFAIQARCSRSRIRIVWWPRATSS